jgi:hypothetical protein
MAMQASQSDADNEEKGLKRKKKVLPSMYV